MTHDPFVLSHKLEDDQSGGHVWGQYSQTNHSMNIPMRQEPLDVAFVEVRPQRHWDISVPTQSTLGEHTTWDPGSRKGSQHHRWNQHSKHKLSDGIRFSV